MDIAALSMNLSTANVIDAKNLAVMKMAMNTGADMSEQMNKMMENMAVDPNLGQHIDLRG